MNHLIVLFLLTINRRYVHSSLVNGENLRSIHFPGLRDGTHVGKIPPDSYFKDHPDKSESDFGMESIEEWEKRTGKKSKKIKLPSSSKSKKPKRKRNKKPSFKTAPPKPEKAPVVTRTSDDQGCPKFGYWIGFKNKCFHIGVKHRLSDDPTKICKSVGAELARIENFSENQLVAGMIKKFSGMSPSVTFGLMTDESKKEWKYYGSDNQEITPSFSNWSEFILEHFRDPSSKKWEKRKSDKYCAHIHSGGLWRPDLCESTIGVACQKIKKL